MADRDQTYFTCTLGQAQRLKLEQQPFQNVIAMIDEQARQLPDSPALGFANFVENHTHRTLTSLTEEGEEG